MLEARPASPTTETARMVYPDLRIEQMKKCLFRTPQYAEAMQQKIGLVAQGTIGSSDIYPISFRLGAFTYDVTLEERETHTLDGTIVNKSLFGAKYQACQDAGRATKIKVASFKLVTRYATKPGVPKTYLHGHFDIQCPEQLSANRNGDKLDPVKKDAALHQHFAMLF